MKKPLNVTKTYLPPIEEYFTYVKRIWEAGQLTNGGPLVRELEQKLTSYLEVEHFYFVNNGTIALQLAIQGLGLTQEIITTPFSYVATLNSIIWEHCKPVFVDIEPDTFSIDSQKIEEAITSKTQAILGVHVFGYPCQVKEIQAIAERRQLKVIYDGAHAIGVRLDGHSIFEYGDISTLSFHSTKLFHTVEGGGITTRDPVLGRKLELMRQFGHDADHYYEVGINGKNSEFHAAMGLCNFPKLPTGIDRRKEICEKYDLLLEPTGLIRSRIAPGVEYNYSYYPLVFNTENQLLEVKSRLAEESIFARRYFYPSLNTLSYVKGEHCPVSESISKRILCLPLSFYTTDLEIEKISEIIVRTLKSL